MANGPEDLEHSHDLAAVRKRIADEQAPHHVADAILGAVDGSITTFAVVAAGVGGGFTGVVVVVLGFAKVVADAFSMAVSNFLGARSTAEEVDAARRMEHRHIDAAPEGELLELREIFARKGFEGDLLDEVVQVIAADRELWVQTMLREELGLEPRTRHPFRAAATTFGAFVAAGIPPLIPFLVPRLSIDQSFYISAAITAAGFIVIGTLNGRALGRPVFKTATETLLTGGTAAALAYLVGWLLRRAYGGV